MKRHGRIAKTQKPDLNTTLAVEELLADSSGLLHDPESPLTRPLVAALVAALVDRRDAEALTRLSESPHRELAKAARKALHDLRRGGVEVPEPSPALPSLAGSAPAVGEPDREGLSDQRRASITAPFGDGERVLVLRFRAAGDRRIHAGVANLSEEKGLRDLQLFIGKSRLYQQMVREMGLKVPAAELPFDGAMWRIAAAAERSRALGRILPEHYGAFRTLVKPEAEQPPPHPAQGIVAGPLPSPEETFALWEDPLLRAWMAPRVLLERLAKRLSELRESPIVISDAQRLTRFGEAMDEAAETLVRGDGRERLALRLQDAAWIAHIQRHRELAGKLLALGEALLGASEPHRFPLCRQLLVRPFLTRIPPALASHLAPGVPAAPDADGEQTEASLLWTPESGAANPGADDTGERIVPER